MDGLRVNSIINSSFNNQNKSNNSGFKRVSHKSDIPTNISFEAILESKLKSSR